MLALLPRICVLTSVGLDSQLQPARIAVCSGMSDVYAPQTICRTRVARVDRLIHQARLQIRWTPKGRTVPYECFKLVPAIYKQHNNM